MPLFYYVSDHEKDAMHKPLDAERLLRMLGASGKLAGFRQAAYMIERVRENPKYVQLITKRLYRETAQKFDTSSSCVERNLRTLIQTCWKYPDHSFLDLITGAPLMQAPTNTQFIDCLLYTSSVRTESVFRLNYISVYIVFVSFSAENIT